MYNSASCLELYMICWVYSRLDPNINKIWNLSARICSLQELFEHVW